MLDNSMGKMFLAAERGFAETDWFRTYNTFNFGEFQSDHKAAFGPLHVLNDETLAAYKKLSFTPDEDVCVLLLPTLGAIIYSDDHGNEALVQAGEVQLCEIPKNTNFTIENPYETDLVNFIHLWLEKPVDDVIKLRRSSFDLNNDRNKLLSFFPDCLDIGNSRSVRSFISKFKGREELTYALSKSGNSLFVFVLEGAFEVQYRLMEAGDGLALWNTRLVEIEALSNDAIILLLDMG